MKDRTAHDQDLAPFFEASQEKQHVLPEAARRRILIEAEALQPKQTTKRRNTWSLLNIFKMLPAGAAMASLSLGVFLGMSQPDSITALAGFALQTEDTSTMFGLGFDSVFDESEFNG